ncbi:MAG: hypothetical protein N2595_08165 [bacterium]|nr:hypothetical protein [bacterium]
MWTTDPCPFLRKEFEVKGEEKDARLYVTAQGLYECVMSGE